MDFEQSLAALKRLGGSETENPARISQERAKPARLLLAGYMSYMIIGWIALSLPFSQVQPIGALDNLFIAVSAVSTTGLVTLDPGTSYTFFGQVVIVLLIQLGGLGYMTVSSFLFLVTKEKLSKTREDTARTSYSLPQSISPRLFIRSVIFFTFACEIVGAAFLYFFFRQAGEASPLWNAVFHSISAFCTAGFSLKADGFVGYVDNVGVTATLAVLSILGAIGFIVVTDTIRRVFGRATHYGFASKVILRMTAFLIVAGALLLFIGESEIRQLPDWERAMAAFFQAMSASTTVGFNTVDIGMLSNASVMLLLFLMIVGASPAGTGGGLKTTSFAALIGLVRSTLKGRNEVRFFKRRVPLAQLHAATTSLACYVGILGFVSFLLFLSEPAARFQSVVFEAASAIGTVGLSMGLTSDLSPIGKVLIILLMTVGRLGVLTFGLATSVHDESREEESDNDLAL